MACSVVPHIYPITLVKTPVLATLSRQNPGYRKYSLISGEVKPTILLATTCRWYTTARLALALANAGCSVSVICPLPHPVSKTRVAERIYAYNGLAPLRSFKDAIAAIKPKFIMPCDDLAAQHLYQLYDRSRRLGKDGESISRLLEHSLGTPEALRILHARAAFIEFAAAEGIRVPKTTAVTHVDQIEDCVVRMGLPMVLKANGTSGGLGVRVVRSRDEAEHAFWTLQAPPLLMKAAKRALLDRDFTLLRPFLLRHRSMVNAQAFIHGHEATSTTLCWNGTVLASLHFEVLDKVRATGHATVLRITENAEMLAATETIARRLNLSGVYGFDFMLEANTGNAYLIEMNPRATQVGHLTLGPGRDIPAALYSALTGGSLNPAPKLTEKDTIALFPHEWLRNPSSVFLSSAHHDVPWEEPDLICACISGARKQSAWYRQARWIGTLSPARLLTPLAAFARSRRSKLQNQVNIQSIRENPAPGYSRNGREFSVPLLYTDPVVWSMHQSIGPATSCSESVKDSRLLNARPSNGKTVSSHLISTSTIYHKLVRRKVAGKEKHALRVLKFGGTSVGDACCIERVVDIIRSNLRETSVVVVVSAMSGVTNSLIDAATQSATGNQGPVDGIFQELRKQHDTAARALIRSDAKRRRITSKLHEIIQEGQRLCRDTSRLGELTAPARDSISSLGERLSTPLLAAALSERGVASEALAATELIITNSQHGAADPLMDLVRERCEARLRALLRRGIVPVVPGFIGATREGVLTTLGRGGSDFSATILAAALGADEVTIWKDVDGMMTADPRLVPDACTIAEISYREAVELANFGSKVLHPKTICPLLECGIPLWIRNTFAPGRTGTKITPTGSSNRGVKALTGISEAALVTLSASGIGTLQDTVARAFGATAAARVNFIQILPSSSSSEVCLAIPSPPAQQMLGRLREALEREQTQQHQQRDQLRLDDSVAIVTIIGHHMSDIAGIVERTVTALSREHVHIVASARGPSECNISFAVAKNDMKAALIAMHREFRLGVLNLKPLLPQTFSGKSPNWLYRTEASA
jgi:aspartate kinase